MYNVYVLLSQKNGKRYVGFTEKSPEHRLKEHNQGVNTWTSQNRPFDLLYSESYSSRRMALKRELYFKSAAGRKFLQKVLKNERS